MQIPMFTIDGTIFVNPNATSSLTLPSWTLSAHSGGEAALTTPAWTITAESHIDPIAQTDVILPALTVSSSAYQEGFAQVDKSLPMWTLSATGTQDGIASLSASIPALIIEAVATAGYVTSLDTSFPAMSLDSSASWLSDATMAADLPSWRIDAAIRTVRDALCLNIKNMALTRYPSYDFNSVAVLSGVAVASRRTGIYEAAGTSDNGTAIPWKIKTGKLDLKSGSLQQVWVAGEFSDNFSMAVTDDGNNSYSYAGTASTSKDGEVRLKVGKGIKTRYVEIEISGTCSTANIDKINIYGFPGSKKR